jgi:aspartate-semialdehyde dehydrogenase
MDPQVPLVVPEVNPAAIADRPLGIIANPNCATIQLVVALAGLHRAGILRRVVVTTLQSVSGAGKRGLDALLRSAAEGAEGGEGAQGADASPFGAPIRGNVIPSIGPRAADGWNEEEKKVRAEAREILGLPDLRVAATCVRVPVEVGHSLSVTAELERALTVAEAVAALRSTAGTEVWEGTADPLPRDVAGQDVVRVGRVRVDPDDPHVLHLWIVADNLRKGAATNAVQIAERLGTAGARAVA